MIPPPLSPRHPSPSPIILFKLASRLMESAEQQQQQQQQQSSKLKTIDEFILLSQFEPPVLLQLVYIYPATPGP